MGVSETSCPMLLLFLAPEFATLDPVVPGRLGVYEALSDEDAALFAPIVAMSCSSAIPVGDAVDAFPLVPKRPSTSMPGTVVVMGGAVM